MKLYIQWQSKQYQTSIKDDAIMGMSTMDFYSILMQALPNDEVLASAKKQQSIKIFDESGDRLYIFPQRPLSTLRLRDGMKLTALQTSVPGVSSPVSEVPHSQTYPLQQKSTAAGSTGKFSLQIETQSKQSQISEDLRLSSPVIESFRERRSSAKLVQETSSPLKQFFANVLPSPKFDREFYESPFPVDSNLRGIGNKADDFTKVALARPINKHKKNQSEPEKYSKTLSDDEDDEFGLKRAQSMLDKAARGPPNGNNERTSQDSTNSASKLIKPGRSDDDITIVLSVAPKPVINKNAPSNKPVAATYSKKIADEEETMIVTRGDDKGLARPRKSSKTQIETGIINNEQQPPKSPVNARSSFVPTAKSFTTTVPMLKNDKPQGRNQNKRTSFYPPPRSVLDIQPAPVRLLLPDLETIKFILRRGPRDNDSLMRCISFLLLGSATPESVQQIRETLAAATMSNPNSFSNDNLTLLAQSYANEIKQSNKLMGAEAELNFFSRYFDIKIFVIEMVLGQPEQQDSAPDDSNNETFVRSYRRNTETQTTFFQKLKNRVLKGPQLFTRIVYYDGTDFSALGTKYLFNAKQFEIDKLSENSGEDFAIILRKNTHGYYDAFVMLQKDPKTGGPIDEHIFNFTDLGGRRRLLKHLCKISLMITDDSQLPKFIAHKEPFMTKKQAMALFLGICILACVIVLGVSILRLLGLTTMGI